MSDSDLPVISRAEGCNLYSGDGDRWIDGVSSLWCNLHGHNHPRINAAITDQLSRVAHVTTLGMSCDTTERFANRLAELAPADLNHVFFASDGSSAVEAALKMAFQYWRQRPDPRPEKTKFLALGSAYHGDTTGSVALGGIEYFHRLFAPILFKVIRGPVPCSYRGNAEFDESERPSEKFDDLDEHGKLSHYVQRFEKLIRQHHRQLAAVVMEPLVQGAAGMITHPPGLLAAIAEMCRRYDVLLIVDEVATGFGRTGTMFACEQESVQPDILCLGKGISGGYLPMSATLATTEIYNAFLGRATDSRQFFHGHTYGGNPLAAAAGIASLDLFAESNLLAAVNHKSALLRGLLSTMADHDHVGNIRGRGLMVGIELVADKPTKQKFAAAQQVGRRVCAAALRRGVWLRPLGDVIVILPPLVISENQLQTIVDAARGSIEEICGTSSTTQTQGIYSESAAN